MINSRTPDRTALGALVRADRRRSFMHAPLSSPQRAVLASQARRKVVVAGRRAGKTTVTAHALLRKALALKVPVLYATLTRANAKEIIWDDLLRLNEEYCLEGEVRLASLEIRMPGGGLVQLRGVNNERETAKIRGKKFGFAAIDEMQSIPGRVAEPLLKSVLGPTLIDYGAELWQTGTRSPVRSGFWWESYAGKLRAGREQHAWDVRQNDMLPAVRAGRSIEEILFDVRTEYGWTESDPTYRREYLNEDVEDAGALLFPIGPQNFGKPPGGRWHHVVSVDLGFDDSDAIAVLGWVEGGACLYLLEEHVNAGDDVLDMTARLNEVVRRYSATLERVVMDTGGLGKKIAETISSRPPFIRVEAAEKERKSEHIKLLQADMRKGLIQCAEDARWAQDCRLVRRDPDVLAATGKLVELRAKAGGYHSDICDAVLYGWRWCRHHLEEAAPVEVAKSTEDRLFASAREAAERASSMSWASGADDMERPSEWD